MYNYIGWLYNGLHYISIGQCLSEVLMHPLVLALIKALPVTLMLVAGFTAFSISAVGRSLWVPSGGWSDGMGLEAVRWRKRPDSGNDCVGDSLKAARPSTEHSLSGAQASCKRPWPWHGYWTRGQVGSWCECGAWLSYLGDGHWQCSRRVSAILRATSPAESHPLGINTVPTVGTAEMPPGMEKSPSWLPRLHSGMRARS